jgi:hypothetical protein
MHSSKQNMLYKSTQSGLKNYHELLYAAAYRFIQTKYLESGFQRDKLNLFFEHAEKVIVLSPGRSCLSNLSGTQRSGYVSRTTALPHQLAAADSNAGEAEQHAHRRRPLGAICCPPSPAPCSPGREAP